MTSCEYPDLDAAVEQSTAELIEQAAAECNMLAIMRGDDGRWYCRVGGDGDPVIMADSYEAIIDLLERQGVLSAVGSRWGETTRKRCRT